MYNTSAQGNKYVLVWLVFCSVLVLSMVMIGGYTRLSGSGLSITEWKPIVGIIPPISDTDWEREFEKYQYSPEYLKINKHFSILKFKEIFYVEYFHRLIGRITAIIFFIPFIYFYFKKYLSPILIKRMVIIGLLGAFQGFSGWYMVRSGLVNNPHVSHFRLALHLLNALLIYSLFFWTVLDYLNCKRLDIATHGAKSLSWFIVILLFFQITLGAFVAGLKGGLLYNSFPLMNGRLLPDEILIFGWSNLSNPAISQFYHRILALISLFAIIYLIYNFYKAQFESYIQKRAYLLLIFFLIQSVIGILTLINIVPIHYALMHQMGAFLLFSMAILVAYSLGTPSYRNINRNI